MNNIEIIISLLLLFMAVPGACRWLGRPALVYPAFVLFGLTLGTLANTDVKTMLHEAGVVGFLLLLFQVGLEIDLPQPRALLSALRFALPWALVQYPVVLLLASVMGFGWVESLLAVTALTGVSVGMSYPAWKNYPNLDDNRRLAVLHILIVLEALTIILLAVETSALETGLSWHIAARLAGIALVVFLVARFAAHMTRLFQSILQQTTQWRTHLLVLLVLVVCALGERLGLSAAKTAFFLGLFMSRAEHDGKGLEDYMAPISQRFLIPIFFVSLGLRVEWGLIFSWTGLLAFGTAGLLLGLREVLHRRWLKLDGGQHAYLMLCPNLTVVALGASMLMENQKGTVAAGWLLLTGLLMTVLSIAFLPVARTTSEACLLETAPSSPGTLSDFVRYITGITGRCVKYPVSLLMRIKDQSVRSFKLQPLARRTEVDLRLVPIGFLAFILVGTALLILPWAHRPGQTVGVIDAAFLAVSATCVTGLATLNVAETLSPFGQAVILGLIQIGGLGIFTAGISLVLLSGRKLSLSDEQVIRTTVGRLRKVRPLDVFVYGCLFIALAELAGTVALYYLIESGRSGPFSMGTLWQAAFHSVSAFCNAGFSIYPEGLVRWRGEPGLLTVISGLVIIGGIGLMTLINLRYYYFWRRDPRQRGYLALQTRLTLAMTLFLLLAGMAITLLFEFNHTLHNASLPDMLSWSFFHSAMSRTAGFNVVDLEAMNQPTLMWTLLLMFIGGGPGSMAGGIKTTTFAVLVLTAWSALRRRDDVQVFGRRLSSNIINIALLLGLLAGLTVMAGAGLLMITEQGHPSAATSQHWLGLVFEAFSAFGTVGLSTGVTPLLTPLGKLVIMALMFIGRVAPLVMTLYLARPRHLRHVRYPSEEIGLG
jgi:trk system potassium uptake protein TrkH